MPTFPERFADEICPSFVTAAGPIDVRARLVDIRVVERVERRKEPKRPGGRASARARARRVDVRKGKLLAGDSGRKIAEVIDLRGAIYQRGSREEGGETRRTVVCEHSRARAKIPRIRVRWISGKGKRGRVFVRFAKCVPR